MSYKYLNEHPAILPMGRERGDGSFRGNVKSSVIIACNCIQKSNFTHISTCNCSSFSTNTAYNAIDKREKKEEKKEKKIRYSDRESNLVVIFRVFNYRLSYKRRHIRTDKVRLGESVSSRCLFKSINGSRVPWLPSDTYEFLSFRKKKKRRKRRRK